MTFEADQIVDRRRLRRKLSFWRVVGIIALIIAVFGGYALIAGRGAFPDFASPQIARVTLNGFITEDRDRDEMLQKLAETDTVKAVIVSIDSTGGVTAGGEALYEALLKLSQKKPTVATVGQVAASAAYMAAIATDHIVARRTSITGSIGVLFMYPEVGDLMDKVGVAVEEIKSSPLKAEPSPFKPASPAAKAVIASVVNDTYDWFVDIVAERRGLDRPAALRLSDGRIYTGQQALSSDLIDEIGGEEQAIAWLEKEHGIDPDLPVEDWEPTRADSSGFLIRSDALLLWFLEKVGVAPGLLHDGIINRFLGERLKLDGLVSVWQGPLGGEAGPAEGAAQ